MSDKECNCRGCKYFGYSDKWDAHYCIQRNMWLEPPCISCEEVKKQGASGCSFRCWDRPEFPDIEKRKKFKEEVEKEAKEWEEEMKSKDANKVLM